MLKKYLKIAILLAKYNGILISWFIDGFFQTNSLLLVNKAFVNQL